MIKPILNKTTVILSLICLATVTLWVSLFFLIDQEKKVILALGLSGQQSGVIQNDKLRLNKDKLVKIDSYFITNRSAIALLEKLDNIGARTGVALTIGQAGDSAIELKLNLTTEGNFSQTMKFLQALENLPYASVIERLELRKGEKVWQSTFTLRILKNMSNV
ncbi:MAG: hypothetical protein WCV68_04315 [Candidatus Paceibacterota bacterium]|jgi:hypothetical protein